MNLPKIHTYTYTSWELLEGPLSQLPARVSDKYLIA